MNARIVGDLLPPLVLGVRPGCSCNSLGDVFPLHRIHARMLSQDGGLGRGRGLHLCQHLALLRVDGGIRPELRPLCICHLTPPLQACFSRSVIRRWPGRTVVRAFPPDRSPVRSVHRSAPTRKHPCGRAPRRTEPPCREPEGRPGSRRPGLR